MRSGVRKSMAAVAKTVSNARRFKFMTSQKIHELKEVKLKLRTSSKLSMLIPNGGQQGWIMLKMK